MKRINNRSGFTLLEIIIVIIIVGVLASLAMPRFFTTINFSRATEALNAMGVAKRAADRCSIMAGAATGTVVFTNCVTFAQIGMEDPGTVPGASFTYATAFATPNWSITATRAAGHTITLTYNTTSGAITRAGTGDFAGIQ